MNCVLHAYSAVMFSRTRGFVARSSLHVCSTSLWGKSLGHSGVRATNLESFLLRFRIQCYSTRKSSKSAPKTPKLDPKPATIDEADAFFVVRKGDTVGVYKSLSECQAQVGSSIFDPPVTVYKGYSLAKETEEYLASCGLKNAIYSFRAAELKEDIFGTLAPCPFQQPHYFEGKTAGKDSTKKRLKGSHESESGEADESTPISTDPMRKHAKLDIQENPFDGNSCILEFDGVSKGNPGHAGAGAVLRDVNGSVICRLREGLGMATCNVAEYRALILGMKYALKKGYTCIRVQGDSKLVYMQLQGRWKAKNENMSALCKEAKKLKVKFQSFEINHVLRELNSEADAQANLAANLADGQFQEELEK